MKLMLYAFLLGAFPQKLHRLNICDYSGIQSLIWSSRISIRFVPN